MVKTFRKGAIVKYVGSEEIATGQTFRVLKKCGAFVEIMFPTKCLDDSIHRYLTLLPIEDFKLV